MKGKLLVISGPSGAGKTTVARMFREKHQDWVWPPSLTTRPIREGEREGIDYFFRTLDEFNELDHEGQLLETFPVTGNMYGTLKQPIDENLSKGNSVMLVKEVNGALAIQKQYPEAVLVAITLEDWDDLSDRLRHRGTDDSDFIKNRIRLAESEIKELDKFHKIVNPQDHPEAAVAEIEKILGI